MRSTLLFKAIIVAILILAIMIPLNMISGTIAERQSFHQHAVESVEQSWAGAQTVAGPVVVVPYRVEVQDTTTDNNGVPHAVTRREDRRWVFFPKTLRMAGELGTGERHRGIHKVLVWELVSQLHARFAIDLPTQVADAHLVQVGQPLLVLGIDDVRGLSAAPSLRVNGQPLPLLQGTGTGGTSGGLHGILPALAAGRLQTLDVALDLHLGGTEQLAIAPLADDNRIELKSAWPSPSFGGRFLPRQRRVSAHGFDAVWTIPALAANTQQAWAATLAGKDARIDLLQLDLVEPVNVYSMTTRASKYGLLFVLLSFVGFLMFEIIKQLPIHPIQYLLVGMALAIFFLLLLSLSEHVPFILAYLAASAACIGLQGFYLSFVLRSIGRGVGFAAMLTALYAALYGLLQSEDNALLLGSLLLFGILAAIMVLTRRIDWYRMAQPKPVASVVDAAVEP